jgi:outer membrane protein assembly factor BamB
LSYFHFADLSRIYTLHEARFLKSIRRVVAFSLLGWLCSTTLIGVADELNSHAPACAATGSERLLIADVDELTKSKKFEEVIQKLEQLFEQSQGRLVESNGLEKASTLATQRYIPIRHWAQMRLHRLLRDNPELRLTYSKEREDVAKVALSEISGGQELSKARHVAERFSQTSLGIQFQLALADLYLERGWGIAAMQVLQRILPSLRYPIRDGQLENGSIPWSSVRVDQDHANIQDQFQQWRERVRDDAWQTDASDDLISQVLVRAIDASAICHATADRVKLFAWIKAVCAMLPSGPQKLILDRLAVASPWTQPQPPSSEWAIFGGDNSHARIASSSVDANDWPTWNRVLERYNGGADRTLASKPRVGEMENGLLSYHPCVYRDRVYVNELSRIVAFDLDKGTSWPSTEPPLPLFDSHIAPSALIPLGYPMVGVVRGTLAIHQDCLYARLGSPVTGWTNGETSPDGSSIAYIVGLDLKRQGSLLKGFPLRLSQSEFAGAEPEGCPLVIGDRLYVAVVKRDNVGLRRSVAAFDRFNGALVWKSPVLASGSVEGSDRANLLSHQLLTEAGGRIYCNTNLGTIACLDLASGQVEWLVRYRRVIKDKQAYPQPDRFRYRDINPCIVHGGTIYCAPQDCPEIFALDATTGDLLWSTDDVKAADATHLLAIHENSLIASGDRLIWLDRNDGTVNGSFPSATTIGNVHALPSPRGLGRGVVSAGEVYWPTVNEILVFSASMDFTKTEPTMRRRIRLDVRGAEGGNIVIVDGWMLIATPSRLLAYANPKED